MPKSKREQQQEAELSPLSATQRALARRRNPSQAEEISNTGPVDTPGEIAYRYYNNGPVDTDAERKVRYDNPGPVDTVNEHRFKDKMQTIKQEPEPRDKPKDLEQKNKAKESDQNNQNSPTPFSNAPRPR